MGGWGIEGLSECISMALWPNGESWRLGMYHLFAGSKKKKYFMANKYLSSVSSVGQEKNWKFRRHLRFRLYNIIIINP